MEKFTAFFLMGEMATETMSLTMLNENESLCTVQTYKMSILTVIFFLTHCLSVHCIRIFSMLFQSLDSTKLTVTEESFDLISSCFIKIFKCTLLSAYPCFLVCFFVSVLFLLSVTQKKKSVESQRFTVFKLCSRISFSYLK